jgi:hypothetical protein
MPDIPEYKCPDVAVVKQQKCPVIPMPSPIPKDMTIIIENGKIVKIDDNGKQLIIHYAETRKNIKNTWGAQ